MFNILSLDVEDYGVDPHQVKTRDDKIGISWFSVNTTTLIIRIKMGWH